MTAVNAGIHEVPGVRVPLQTSYGSGDSPEHGGAVLMYSAGCEGVTLQLREPEDVLARLHHDDTTLSISYHDSEMLADSGIDVLLGSTNLHNSGSNGTSSFDLFDSDNGQDLTLSPETFTSSTEAFMNDNSDSLGVSGDGDTVGSTDDIKGAADSSKLAVKKPRPKAASPNRQGPQQCQVCGKVFGNASALAKHKLTHSDERKYVCTMCGKAFKRQDHLNGHMLTHRNKKPYECKADGCGKSYCDARSLRRHTENHHTGSSGSSCSSTTGTTGGSSGRDTASPLASSCIQYAPPPAPSASCSPTSSTASPATPAKAPSQLQQLLASDTATATSTTKVGNNDGLTKQQLDLIHQIMQQTQQQASQQKLVKVTTSNGISSCSSTVSVGTSSSSSSSSSVSGKASVLAKAKSWTSLSPAVAGAVKPSLSSSVSQSSQVISQAKNEPKPVECNLCHRKFKNIPALNGHMRLHGGYFKKDSDSKKNEKKESPGPPLQTASVSVRALIEEKIIQKRSSNNGLSNISSSHGETNGLKAQVLGTSASNQTESDLNIKLSSFVVPAPPALSPMSSAEKLRRHSDTEHFSTIRGVSQDAQALADLLMKRNKKVSVKRASSDPGTQLAPSSPLTLSTSSSPGPAMQLTFHSSDYSLGGVNYSTEDAGYFSPSLQEDVFQTVSADSMLLQGVDTNQLAESLHFQASLLHENGENMNLEYHSDHNEELQAVLNSPLPAGLAELGVYSETHSSSPKDLPNNKDFGSYVNSPHPSLSTASPLPSPLSHTDSPSFTYPTPPSSQEGHSPAFGQSMHTDSFVQSVISGGGNAVPVPVSSPLSAAFYTSTMSSAAAVEEALSQVLPLDSQNSSCGGSIRLNMYQPSPSPHSPISVPPVSSPLSLSNLPATSSVSSPLPQNTFTLPQSHQFPMSPQQTLQSQMMPNSDDPLLSSSPKDFASKKKFDFNSLHSFKLIGNGMVDLGNGGFGIVVDTNGELKLFQTGVPQSKSLVVSSCGQSKGLVLTSMAQPVKGIVMSPSQQSKSFVMNSSSPQTKGLLVPSNTLLTTSTASAPYLRKIDSNNLIKLSPKNNSLSSGHLSSPANMAMRLQRVKLPVALDNIKEEPVDEMMASPSRWTPSPTGRALQRRITRSDSLPLQHPCYQSRLRAPRVRGHGSVLPYTPPPMLSPSRPGQGLYWQAAQAAPASSCLWPTSTTTYGVADGAEIPETPPETCVMPRVNVGSKHQAVIPPAPVCNDRSRIDRDPSHEHLLWDPGISKFCTDSEIDMFLEFSCCAAVPGGGRNKEYALHLLHMCQYNIHDAMLKLMQPTPWLPPGHPLLSYEFSENDKWSADEIEAFHQGMLKFDKDFRTIAQEIGSKTAKHCIQFYYLWKKICPEEYKRLRLLKRRKEVEPNMPDHSDMDLDDTKVESSRHCSPISDNEMVSTTSESRLFTCEYSDCSASFNSRAALSGHIRIHGGTMPGRAPTPDRRGSFGDCLEEFPCKICGKIFSKVKSRSAHMKSHRPADAEPKKAKPEGMKMEVAGGAAGGSGSSVTSSGICSKLC